MAVENGSLLHRLKSWLAGATRGTGGPPIGPPGEAPAPRSRPEGGERWDEILRVQELTLSLLTSKVTPDELFRHVVDGAADSLGADEASLMLLEGDDLRVASSTRTPAG